MEVRTVLFLSASNLGREDLVCAINDCAGDPFGELASLLRCYNLVENEVALDYFPLKKEETVSVKGGILPFCRLSLSPVQILSVTDENGVPLDFTLRPARLIFAQKCGERKVKILYTYSPKEKRFCDRSEFGGRISARLLSFGVCCEFCLTSGRYAEAAVWEKRFRDALRAAETPRRPLIMRSRRWV